MKMETQFVYFRQRETLIDIFGKDLWIFMSGILESVYVEMAAQKPNLVP